MLNKNDDNAAKAHPPKRQLTFFPKKILVLEQQIITMLTYHYILDHDDELKETPI